MGTDTPPVEGHRQGDQLSAEREAYCPPTGRLARPRSVVSAFPSTPGAARCHGAAGIGESRPLPRGEVLLWHPAGLVAWCRALGITGVRVERRRLEVLVTARIDHEGVSIHLASSLPGRSHPAARIVWDMHRRSLKNLATGWCSVAGVQRAIDACPQQDLELAGG